MAQATWEKTGSDEDAAARQGVRWKFIVAGLALLAAVAYLIISGTTSGARYYITIDELLNNPEYVGQTVRISGAVVGETIQYDPENLIIEFTIANVPQDYQDLAWALHEAVHNPEAARLPIYIERQVKPDLLQHEAQAILTGKLGSDGIFRASELLLKCPSRFEGADPNKAISGSGK